MHLLNEKAVLDTAVSVACGCLALYMCIAETELGDTFPRASNTPQSLEENLNRVEDSSGICLGKLSPLSLR